ncbi:hypothetical protein [Aporhodopirellula aestuarii]|uniref:Uncharacterized protein n=1 Tax=Aporhodopirellula aestuarii TaxID=2950107 RepID=A0ABT0U4W3_9BACT|nr:hypothetical protein [Aporhodopirellula aestuarii]MCM2371977.1 hypothetical protein [Aporhodopirellula aestuarii]
MLSIGVDAPAGAALEGGRVNEATADCEAPVEAFAGAFGLETAGDDELGFEATALVTDGTIPLGSVKPPELEPVDPDELDVPAASRVGVISFKGGIANADLVC